MNYIEPQPMPNNRMREIKFRAWDPIQKREVSIIDFSQNPFYWSQNLHGDYMYLQYTGLNDKNGVEIYEGDILRNTKYEQLVEVFRQEHKTSEDNWISWGGWSFRKLPSDDRMTYALYANHIEVVGSIYENPELLTPTE